MSPRPRIDDTSFGTNISQDQATQGTRGGEKGAAEEQRGENTDSMPTLILRMERGRSGFTSVSVLRKGPCIDLSPMRPSPYKLLFVSIPFLHRSACDFGDARI
jgi:hypothetical protein